MTPRPRRESRSPRRGSPPAPVVLPGDWDAGELAFEITEQGWRTVESIFHKYGATQQPVIARGKRGWHLTPYARGEYERVKAALAEAEGVEL